MRKKHDSTLKIGGLSLSICPIIQGNISQQTKKNTNTVETTPRGTVTRNIPHGFPVVLLHHNPLHYSLIQIHIRNHDSRC